MAKYAVDTSQFSEFNQAPAAAGTQLKYNAAQDVKVLNHNEEILRGMTNVITKGIPLAFASGVSTIIESLPGVGDNEVKDFFIQHMPESYRQYYKQHEGAIGVTGDIALSFVPIIGATKLIRAPSALGRFATKMLGEDSKVVKSLFSTGKSIEELAQPALEAAALSGKKFHMSVFTDRKFANEFYKAWKTTAGDILKESIAADVALAATMNSSDFFFPENVDKADTLAMFAAFDIGFAAAGSLAMPYAIRRGLAINAERLAKHQNLRDLPLDEAVHRAEARDGFAATWAAFKSDAEEELKAAAQSGDSELATNLRAVVNQIDKQLYGAEGGVVFGMAADRPFAELNRRWSMSPDYVQSILKPAFDNDPAMFVNLRSIDEFTQSYVKKFQASEDYVGELARAREKQILKPLQEKLEKLENSSKDVPEEKLATLEKRISDEQKYIERLKSTSQFALEPDGSLIPLSMRKMHGEEFDSFRLTRTPQTGQNAGADSRSAFVIRMANEHGDRVEFRVLNNGMFELPASGKQSAEELVKKVTVEDTASFERAGKKFQSVTSVNLRNIGDTWSFTRAREERAELANQVYDSLSPDLKRIVDRWISGAMREARDVFSAQPQLIDELQTAYRRAGLHDALREVANPDGTITLYRGESKAETMRALNGEAGASELVSTTPVLETARAFASSGNKHVVKLRVPVDDVVGVIGGFRGEYEFLIRGAAERRALQGTQVLSTRNWADLTFGEKTALYHGAREYVRRFVKNWNGSKEDRFVVNPGDNFVRADMAVEIAKQHGLEALNLPSSMRVKSIDDLEFWALDKKYEAYLELRKRMQEQQTAALTLPKSQQLSLTDIAKELNLPTDTAILESPILRYFDDLAAGGVAQSLTDIGLSTLKDVEKQITSLYGTQVREFLGTTVDQPLKLRGSMLNPERPELKPVILTFENGPQRDVSLETLNNIVASQRAAVLKRLQAGDGESEIPQLVADLLKVFREQQPVVQQAKQVQLLYDGIQSGANRATTAPHAYRTSPVLTAMDRYSDLLFKESLQVAKRDMQEFESSWHAIQAKKNEASLLQFNNFVNARRHGWDLDADVKEIEPGKFAWVLDRNSDFNRKRWQELFDEPYPADTRVVVDESGNEVIENIDILMPNPARVNGKIMPVVADSLAVEAARGISELSQRLGQSINHMRFAEGKPALNIKPWHLPPVNLANQEVVFLAKPTGEVVAVVGGPTFAQARDKAMKEIAAAKQRGESLVMHTKQTMENHFDMLNEAFGSMKDFSTSFLQTGRATGRSAGSVIDTTAQTLQDQIRVLADQYQTLTRQFNFLTFEPQVNFAKFRKEASNLGEAKLRARRTIWDQYQAALLQRQQLNPQTALGKLYFGVEHAYNMAVKAAIDKLHNYNDLSKVGLVGEMDERGFELLKQSLGDFNPFESAFDFAQRTENLKTPPSLRKHVGTLTRVTTDLTLRIIDLGMAAVNMLSPFGILPAVVKGLQRQPGESVEFWKQRIAAYATPISDGRALWNPSRAMASGIHFVFSPEWQKVKADARARGLLTQEVAERMDVLAHPAEGYVKNIVNNYVKKLSKPTDWSELWSRGFSFAIGYNMGRRMLQLSHEDSLLFAHRIANETIGDFRPAARPQMFQGAVGMPLGLFTTFMWNFWQRIFRDLEGRNLGAVALQGVLQQSLYGAESLPYFDQFVNAFTTTYDGQENMVDRLRSAYGDTATDLLLYGAVANLPKLFGADTGIAVQTRADVQFPIDKFTSLTDLKNLPSVSLLDSIYQGINKSVDSLIANKGFNARQQAEILSNFAPLGFVRELTTVALGYDVDRRGNVINSQIDSATEIAARMFELKTLDEHKKIRELSRTQAIQKRRQELLERLAGRVKTAARGGGLKREDLNDWIREYIRIGGDYDMFKRFMRSNLLKGVTEKDRLEMLRAFKSSYRQNEAARYLMLNAPETNAAGEYQ